MSIHRFKSLELSSQQGAGGHATSRFLVRFLTSWTPSWYRKGGGSGQATLGLLSRSIKVLAQSVGLL